MNKPNQTIKTPVVFFIFNRPVITAKTFDIIRKQRPSELFIVADGPREGNSEDILKCSEVRNIVEKINWPCMVQRNYSNINLGLKKRISSGLDWVFSNVDRAIILEDDVAPSDSFFHFCEVLLEDFKNDRKIVSITGNNFQDGLIRNHGSYYFSKYSHVWGWATWKRAWDLYEEDIQFWPEWSSSEEWKIHTPDKVERKFWDKIFSDVAIGKINSTWDYSWTASIWRQGGLTITPNVNLVKNIGFGKDASHTKNIKSKYSNMETQKLSRIIHMNEEVTQNIVADKYTFDNHYGGAKLRFPIVILFHIYKFSLSFIRKYYK